MAYGFESRSWHHSLPAWNSDVIIDCMTKATLEKKNRLRKTCASRGNAAYWTAEQARGKLILSLEYPGDVDIELIPLLDLINSVPGVRTLFSCSLKSRCWQGRSPSGVCGGGPLLVLPASRSRRCSSAPFSIAPVSWLSLHGHLPSASVSMSFPSS